MISSFKLTIYIPVEQVGIVIGRQGGTINRIQTASSSRLNVVPDPDNSAWAPVYIKGTPDAVFAAAKLVDELVEELDDAVVEFSLPAKARHHLRGASGSSDDFSSLSVEAKRISAETCVRIRVPPAPPQAKGAAQQPKGTPPPVDDAEAVTLEGSLDGCRRALQLVLTAANRAGKDAGRIEQAKQMAASLEKKGLQQAKQAPPLKLVERNVEVPGARLRLLVARRGQQQPVFRMIARYSGAAVVKCPSPATPVAAAPDGDAPAASPTAAAARVVTDDDRQEDDEDDGGEFDDDGDDSEDDDEDDEGDDDDDDDEEEDDDDEDDDDAQEDEPKADAGAAAGARAGAAASQPEAAAHFTVRGTEANVEAACVALQRVVGGEAVKDVMASLKKTFPTAASRRARGGGGGGGGGAAAGAQPAAGQSRRSRKRGGGGGGGGGGAGQQQQQQGKSTQGAAADAAAATSRRKTRGGRRRNGNGGAAAPGAAPAK
ncbi:hypothetical protein M885DRAFT_619861 [Pelagophyceae sp. CCMP2097]|nr:hypothetical protein M885DRAFT_619861 [Pelagophyceae sp. CCMP2097]